MADFVDLGSDRVKQTRVLNPASQCFLFFQLAILKKDTLVSGCVDAGADIRGVFSLYLALPDHDDLLPSSRREPLVQGI